MGCSLPLLLQTVCRHFHGITTRQSNQRKSFRTRTKTIAGMHERDRFCTSARDLWDENIFQKRKDGKLLSNQNLMHTDSGLFTTFQREYISGGRNCNLQNPAGFRIGKFNFHCPSTTFLWEVDNSLDLRHPARKKC